MRKITLNPRIGPKGNSVVDFDNDWIVIKDGKDLEELKAPRIIESRHYQQFTEKQLKVINNVNYILEYNNKKILSQEEAEYLIFPFGRDENVKTEDLQALAGFSVKKEVRYE